MTNKNTFEIEDKYMAPFFVKQKVSIEKGKGIYVWDEEGNKFIDFTSGWGVTCLGHSHPVIIKALQEQGTKIIQNPNSGLTYSPARARLLATMREILPENLTHIFFSNSGAESNDAAIKLARKVTGRTDIISSLRSFHGRTISTASATGQIQHREKFNPLMPNYRFVVFGNSEEMSRNLDENVAAVILEPVQGEGGVRIPPEGYFAAVKSLCQQNGSLLIVDEIQTGFCRTGPMFAIDALDAEVDFLTMAKGIAGGFPFGAFAMSQKVVDALELGDHGGTYCGNPLGCAVADAVIRYLIDEDISNNVQKMGYSAIEFLNQLKEIYPDTITDVRGIGLLLIIEFSNEHTAAHIAEECFKKRLFVRQTQGTGIRIFPALNIKKEELEEGLEVLKKAIETVVNKR